MSAFLAAVLCCPVHACQYLECFSSSIWPQLLLFGAVLLLICKFMFHGDLGSVRQDIKKKKKKEAREIKSPKKNKKNKKKSLYNRVPQPQKKKQSEKGTATGGTKRC